MISVNKWKNTKRLRCVHEHDHNTHKHYKNGCGTKRISQLRGWRLLKWSPQQYPIWIYMTSSLPFCWLQILFVWLLETILNKLYQRVIPILDDNDWSTSNSLLRSSIPYDGRVPQVWPSGLSSALAGTTERNCRSTTEGRVGRLDANGLIFVCRFIPFASLCDASTINVRDMWNTTFSSHAYATGQIPVVPLY